MSFLFVALYLALFYMSFVVWGVMGCGGDVSSMSFVLFVLFANIITRRHKRKNEIHRHIDTTTEL